MTYRVIFKCDVCLEECGRDCMGLHFTINEDFRLVPGSDQQGRHICLRCCASLRDQLVALSKQPASPLPQKAEPR